MSRRTGSSRFFPFPPASGVGESKAGPLAIPPPISANLFSVHLKYSESCGKRRRGGSAKAVEMSFHSSMICANGMRGSMARDTWLKTNLNSRHALRGRGRVQVVPYCFNFLPTSTS